jgi:hypothetical protein
MLHPPQHERACRHNNPSHHLTEQNPTAAYNEIALEGRAYLDSDPETLREKFGANWPGDVPNRWPIELTPNTRAPDIRSEASKRIVGLMAWDVLGGQTKWA